MSSDEIAICLHNVNKTYRVFGHAGARIKQAMTFGLRKYHEEFTALMNVSLEVKKGETVGVVGRNGAGKSTLLQLICGIIRPTSGTVQVNGRISAMLELGAGFNPEFTGRENAYFQGFLMGFKEEQMRKRFDAIECFADIGSFIDQPVRTYSTGMFVRLAFSVATHIDPDIFVIDEVLAVGDALFQQKCIDRVNKLQSAGTTIVVVSHDPYHIERMCHKAAVLRQGRLSDLHAAKEILTDYNKSVQEELVQSPSIIGCGREGTQEVYFEKVFLETSTQHNVDKVSTTEPLRIIADFVAKQPIDSVHFRFELYSSHNELIAVVTTRGRSETRVFNGSNRIAFGMDACQLTSGWYYITAIAGHKYARLDTWHRVIDFKAIMSDPNVQNLSMDRGIFVLDGAWNIPSRCSSIETMGGMNG